MGAGDARSRKTAWSFRSLRLRSGGRGLLKNWGCLADFGDTEEDERRIRPGLQTAVCVVDIDVGLSEARRHSGDLARSVRKFD